MRKRELLLGFGAGMIVAAAITGWFQAKQTPSETKALSSEEIKNAAKDLQMVVLTKEEYDQWQQEKKVNLKSAPEPPQAPAAPTAKQTAQPQTPGSQETNAPQVPATASGNTKSVPLSPDQPTAAQKAETSAAKTPVSVANPTPPAVQVPQVTRQVSFTVPYKATAEGVARQLVDVGVLPADNKFVDELRKQDKLNRIRVGTYQVSLPTTEAQIVKLITTPPQK